MSSLDKHSCVDDDKLVADVNKFGWSVILIEATDYLPSFAYTIGLYKNYRHPELISFGLTTKTLHVILNTAGELVKNGQVLITGKSYDDFFESVDAQFLKVNPNNMDDYFGYAIWFNGDNTFPAMQLVWTDRSNKFPWDNGFDKEFELRQPLLDRNAGFKFREVENLAVFTTRQWIELDKPILRVIHEEDGDWQFLTGDQMPDDAKIVALKSIINKDKTINSLFNLDYGEQAERLSIDDKWVRGKVNYE